MQTAVVGWNVTGAAVVGWFVGEWLTVGTGVAIAKTGGSLGASVTGASVVGASATASVVGASVTGASVAAATTEGTLNCISKANQMALEWNIRSRNKSKHNKKFAYGVDAIGSLFYME